MLQPPYSYPQSLSALTRKIVSRLSSPQKAMWCQIVLNWPTIVGHKFATHTCPKKIQGRLHAQGLTLVVDSWCDNALELSYEAAIIVEKINQYLGQAHFRKVIFQTTSPPKRTRRFALSKSPTTAPEVCAKEIHQTPNERLKSALKRLDTLIPKR
jgi:hypothetical protein